MPTTRGFHDLLFEVSNESRYEILVLLSEKPMRNTGISRELDLTSPETRRQVSRLGEVGLIQRDLEGFYHLTPYGEMSLILFQEIQFITGNRDYFQTHTTKKVPVKFVKRIGELSESTSLGNTIDFIRYMESLFKESNEYVWLLVDQFPLNSLSTIIDAIERGVQFKIVEPIDRVLNPDLESLTSEETQALIRARHTPLVEQRMLDQVSVFLYLSDKKCIVAFPNPAGENDYRGFISSNDTSIQWCRQLFQHFWDEAETRSSEAPSLHLRRRLISEGAESRGPITVVGREDSASDAQAVQDAVDNYDEVILKGTFNFGASEVVITRSTIIRGEGQEDNVPLTRIYKQGWNFPFTEYDAVFRVDAEDIDVTIENINFTDFNCACITGYRGKTLNIKTNRITLETGFGRGMTFGAFGDLVIGIQLVNHEGLGNFPYGVNIVDNYIDFARGGARGGYITRGGIEEDPTYRPDLPNHEYYIGIGIVVNHALGKVIIENNTVRNTNARGILAYDNMASSDVRIRHNIVESDVYGSYAFYGPDAGVGILAQSGFSFPRPSFNVEITGNNVRFEKLNHCGIAVLGPVIDREGVGKLSGGSIRNNDIQLKNGYVGIHVRKCDDFEVADNSISGEAYYGVRISGRRRSGGLDLRALNNLVEGSDMDDLRIRDPDEYSTKHVDGRFYKDTQGKSATAHVWLDTYSKDNVIVVKADETVIDEGENNKNSIHEETL